MKRLEVRLTREPGQERVVGQLAETGSRPAGAAMPPATSACIWW
jgi:hypothetical protein